MTAEIINLVTAVAALAAVLVAGLEFRGVLRARRASQRAELDGVAVQWHPLVRPNHAEADGSAVWKYEITVHNPGHLPIRGVSVALTFPFDVRRIHHDATLDAPTRTLRLHQSVIIAGGTRTWRRSLRISFDDRNRLPEVTADVRFTPLRGPSRTNHMDGRPPTEGSAP